MIHVYITTPMQLYPAVLAYMYNCYITRVLCIPPQCITVADTIDRVEKCSNSAKTLLWRAGTSKDHATVCKLSQEAFSTSALLSQLETLQRCSNALQPDPTGYNPNPNQVVFKRKALRNEQPLLRALAARHPGGRDLAQAGNTRSTTFYIDSNLQHSLNAF